MYPFEVGLIKRYAKRGMRSRAQLLTTSPPAMGRIARVDHVEVEIATPSGKHSGFLIR